MSLSRVWNSVVNPKKNEAAQAGNGIGQNLAGLFDAANMGVIFGLLIVGAAVPEILFLIAMGASLLKAGMAWRAAWQEGFYDRTMYDKAIEAGRSKPRAFLQSMNHSFVNALKETLFAGLISAAVIVALFIPVFPLLSRAITPAIFAAYCGSNISFNLFSSFFYAGKAAQEVEIHALSENGKEANANTKASKKDRDNALLVKPAPTKAPSMNAKLRNMYVIGTVLAAVFAVCVVSLFLLPPLGLALSAVATTVMASVGLAAATAAIGLCIYGIVENAKAIKTVAPAKKVDDSNVDAHRNTNSESSKKVTEALEISSTNPDKENHNLLEGNSPSNKKSGLRQRRPSNRPILIAENAEYAKSQSFYPNHQPAQSKSVPNFRSFTGKFKA